MTNLAADRIRTVSFFAYVTLDMFLLFMVKQCGLFSFVCKVVLFT